MSGGYHGVAAPHLETLAETEAKGVRLQQAMKAKDIAQMRTIPADQIAERHDKPLGPPDQGMRRDDRGEEQPADKQRAQQTSKTGPGVNNPGTDQRGAKGGADSSS